MGVTKQEIWERAKLSRVAVEGSPCFEGVYVRGMMLDEFTGWEAWCDAHKDDEPAIARRIVIDFCVDENGAPIFTKEDAQRVGTLPPDAFMAAAAAFAKVNEQAAADAENAAKNGKRRRRTSGTNSPATSGRPSRG